MHNNLKFSMHDGLYSITNYLFYPYHSWIDVQLEMKIRSCQDQNNANIMTRILSDQTAVRQQLFDPILNPNK
jgi:hypothetical protein